jgi:DmsE family decaheme c-type cytochrome
VWPGPRFLFFHYVQPVREHPVGGTDAKQEGIVMRLTKMVAALAALVVLLGGGHAYAQGATPAAWSVTDCQGCHEKALGPTFQKTSHAKVTESCAKCHKGVGEHAKAMMAGDTSVPTPSLKKLTAQQINATCLECHEKNNQANYGASMHDRRNVACTTCHSVHSYKSAKAQLKTVQDSETCFTCHKSERAKSMRTSHHPVREGKMGCTSCHNPHDGSREKMIKADSVNELCYSCHTEKRGPFLFEHAPVREDCVSCHEPHGSNHNRLLQAKLPNLCWNCHFTGSGHFPAGDNLMTEEGVKTTSVSGFPTVQSRFVEKSCKNCHVNIHGSNSPSGAYFVR